jgi:hypothetical protein
MEQSLKALNNHPIARYNGIKEELLHMEEIKLRCMLSLFHRAVKDCKIEAIIENCNKVIWV